MFSVSVRVLPHQRRNGGEREGIVIARRGERVLRGVARGVQGPVWGKGVARMREGKHGYLAWITCKESN